MIRKQRSIALYEQDYSSVLGLTLSLLKNQVLTRCYTGRSFRSRQSLNAELTSVMASDVVTRSTELTVAFQYLERGLRSLMNVCTFTGIDPDLHESFFNAGVEAEKAESHSMEFKHRSEKDHLKSYEKLLLAVKVQIICAFFRQLELKYDIVRDYPGPVENNPLDIVDRFMSSSFIRDATRNLRVKGWTMHARGRGNGRGGKAQVKTASLKEIPSAVSKIISSALSVDRIVETYKEGTYSPAKHSRIFHVGENPSVFQVRMTNIAKKDSPKAALITQDSSSNSITSCSSNSKVNLYFHEPEKYCGPSETWSDLGVIELETGEAEAFASNSEWFLVGYKSGDVGVYSAGTLELVTTLAHDFEVSSVFLESSGKRVYVGGKDGQITEWNSKWETVSNLETQISSTSEITCFGSDEGVHASTVKYLFSGHKNGSIDAWNLLANETTLLFTISNAHKSKVTSLTGRSATFFSASEDNYVKVWDLSLKTCGDSKIQHSGKVSNVVVDSDIIFTSSDKILRGFDRCTLEKVFEIELHHNITSLHLDENRNLYTYSKNIRKWNVEAIIDAKISVESRTVNGRKTGSQYYSMPNGKVNFSSEKKRRLHIRTKPRDKKKKGNKKKFRTISSILSDPKQRSAFMQFLKESYADENLSFWIAVQRYREFFLQENVKQEALASLGRDIVNEFIVDDAPHAVNIDSDKRDELEALTESDFTAESFNDTEKEIVRLLESNFLGTFQEKKTNEQEDSTQQTRMLRKIVSISSLSALSMSSSPSMTSLEAL